MKEIGLLTRFVSCSLIYSKPGRIPYGKAVSCHAFLISLQRMYAGSGHMRCVWQLVSTCETGISSSSFHRLDMTLAVAEALSPNKPNQTNLFETPNETSFLGSLLNLVSDNNYYELNILIIQGLGALSPPRSAIIAVDAMEEKGAKTSLKSISDPWGPWKEQRAGWWPSKVASRRSRHHT